MKILIKTFVLGANHGQYLQALGLLCLTKDLLPNANVVHSVYNNHIYKEILVHLKSLTIIKYFRFLWAWKKNFRFVPRLYKAPIAVYGSDMIFHLQSKLFKADPYYFTANHEKEFSIAYAPSTSWRDTSREPAFVNGLLKFQNISVRDQSTQELVFETTNLMPPIVCDPAFFVVPCLFKGLDFIDTIVNNEIVVYGSLCKISSALPYGFLDKYSVRELAYFKRKNIIRSLHFQIQDPIKVLKHYSSSLFVLTNTFHGVIIALITKKPFIAVADKNLLARLSEYQKFFGEERLINSSAGEVFSSQALDLFLYSTADIDYNGLDEFIEYSKEWYSSALRRAISMI